MIRNRHLAKWLMITLIMAIGIGTFGALYINSEKKKEANDAQPSSYLTNQRQHDIDMTELKSCLGEYQAVESGRPDDENYVPESWHLFISEDHEEKGPYLSIYDGGAGNGFEGRIMYLKDDILIIEIDPELYEGMPADWSTEGDGKYAILNILAEDDGIVLGYRGSEVRFKKDN